MDSDEAVDLLVGTIAHFHCLFCLSDGFLDFLGRLGIALRDSLELRADSFLELRGSHWLSTHHWGSECRETLVGRHVVSDSVLVLIRAAHVGLALAVIDRQSVLGVSIGGTLSGSGKHALLRLDKVEVVFGIVVLGILLENWRQTLPVRACDFKVVLAAKLVDDDFLVADFDEVELVDHHFDLFRWLVVLIINKFLFAPYLRSRI